MLAPCPCRVAVIGSGLIGTSLGWALRALAAGRYIVTVYDRDPGRALQAAALGAADAVAESQAEAVRDVDVVVAAVPAQATASVLIEASFLAPPAAVFTDVASVKSAVLEAVTGRLAGGQAFVGGHPMAGSEQAGPVGSDPYLFQNATWVITPAPDAPERAVATVWRMVEDVGARPVRMEAGTHDEAAAMASHVPHLAAIALVLATGACDSQGIPACTLASTGFRDATRLALSSEAVWLPILELNREAIAQAATLFRREVDRLLGAIERGEQALVRELWLAAGALRRDLRAPAKGYGHPTLDLVVRLEDRPGSIARVCGILGERGINIADIEILRVREGAGGTLRLGFASGQALNEALACLQERGFTAWPRTS